MTIVRDNTQPKGSYKGHPCWAVAEACPCRPCFNCHDCRPPDYAKTGKVYSDTFHCATNWNSGCPYPYPEPVHDLNRVGHCRRCGIYITKSKPRPEAE